MLLTTIQSVEQRGVEPRPPDFQSGASTELASAPLGNVPSSLLRLSSRTNTASAHFSSSSEKGLPKHKSAPFKVRLKRLY